MSWAEEQPWFGLEDQALASLREREENGFYIELIGFDGSGGFIDYPYDSIEEAEREIHKYRGRYKTMRIYHGKPY